MPTRVRPACASGWIDRMSVPAAAASKLIAYINRPGADLIAVRDGEALGVAEQIAPKVGDDALLELGVHVAVQHVEGAADDRDDQAGDHGQRQQQEPVRSESAEHVGDGSRQRRLANDVVDQDLERPRRQQAKQGRADRQPDRATRRAASTAGRTAAPAEGRRASGRHRPECFAVIIRRHHTAAPGSAARRSIAGAAAATAIASGAAACPLPARAPQSGCARPTTCG